jgi:hypothetical protein
VVTYAKLGESRREVNRIASKEVSMDAIQHTTNLRARQYVGYGKHARPRTGNVTFPSLKKYASCLTSEASSVACPPLGVLPSSENPGRLVCLAPNSALGSLGALVAVGDSVSENVESNETMEAALDRTGDKQISLSLQETMQGAIKRKNCF